MTSEATPTLPTKGENRPDAVAYGRDLRQGLGVNLLVRDVPAEARFLVQAFGVSVSYFDDDFAIVAGFGAEWMLHSDGSYQSNPLIGVVRGSDEAGGVRGAGIELRLYGCDPDAAVVRVEALIEVDAEAVILAAAMDKPHGQREAVIIDPEGYVWVPGIPI
ncbi:MAG: glyoxalase [Rhodobacteraceae bacterium]|nr:glyoxalase [Paracoccaceae bacterium]